MLWASQVECHLVPLHTRGGRYLYGWYLQSSTAQRSRWINSTTGKREYMYFWFKGELSSVQSPSCAVHISAKVWRALPKYLAKRGGGGEGKNEERIKSYLYVVGAFCRQSASKDFLPCPLSPCQIVIEPSWKSKKPSTHSLWHQLPLFVSPSIRQTHMHISSWKGEKKKKKSVCYLGALQRHTTEQTELHSASRTSPLETDFILC